VLFDLPLLVQHLEGPYRQMWREYENGELPQPDLSNLDVDLDVGILANHEDVEVQMIGDFHGWWAEQVS
jgi:hypothetical protein